MSLNPDLLNQEVQCKCPREVPSNIEPDIKEYGEIRVRDAANSYSNQNLRDVRLELKQAKKKKKKEKKQISDNNNN